MSTELEPSDEERLWQVLALIPSGRISSYGRLAKQIGLLRGARRVGRMLGSLPARTRLPWHRVVRASGELALPPQTGSGYTQVQRLRAEGVEVRGGRVRGPARYFWP